MDSIRVESRTSPSSSMSSQDVQRVKRRRLHGSCDTCRKKKIKCDSANMPDNICTNCRASNIHCGHTIPRQGKKKKEPQNSSSYIKSLEERLEKMERLLEEQAHVNMDTDTFKVTPGEGTDDTTSFADTKKTLYSEHRFPIPDVASRTLSSSPSPSVASDQASETDDLAHIALAEHLSQLSLRTMDDRFFGQSSAFMFVKHASTIRSEITGTPNKPDPSRFRRPLYWDIQPWEAAFCSSVPSYTYPENDLLQSLVSLYFEKMNTLFPLLHRPTFLRSLLNDQHLWDPSFGMTVLLVCSIGSRYSHDPRVLMPGDTCGTSSGWHYFSQVQVYRNPLIYRSTIHDLQYYVLAILYLGGTGVPHASWNIIGLGMRHALEKGAHRRKPSNQKPSAEEELLKRAFWCLYCIDQFKSSFLGRPCSINDEDFDLEYPIECDDEYWETEDPELAFKQPSGKPCKISGFVRVLKLCEILAFGLRTLYSTKKSRILSGLRGDEWECRVVAALDSSMNKWKDSLPDHLTWGPDIPDSIFFHQSVFLHVSFYYVQILIHRPFLTKKSSLSFPSLAMCTNAARSSIHILEVAVTRGFRPTHHLVVAAFTSGIVIVLNLWGHQRSGLVGKLAREMEDLQKCINVLKECENKWHVAGRFRDMLSEVGSLGEYQLTMNKRPRESSSVDSSPPESPTDISFPPTGMGQTPLSSGMSLDNSKLPMLATFDPAGPMHANEFDLHDLLLVQMGYLPPHFGENPQQQVPRSAPVEHTSQLGAVVTGDLPSVPNTSAFMTTEDMISLLSDIPTTFNVDEWDAYLRDVGQSSSEYPGQHISRFST
ncbi:hypothetical protein GALMADRAFT_249193 [Galerina marginata CBS 339.88]|uniref:Zn(2)-C6 fungal-type domain-containing protein n=1 Tax=Galerina marginata (strain CBS 339.88) TaxID=685588 RepID=A0A067T888_GALM3|nr:hypothetical protein GALMADRAFT_249193 [Galerina marginata CBS 339.88]